MDIEHKLALSNRLASLEWADPDLVPYVDGPDSLLEVLVLVSDGQGRYYADIPLLSRVLYHNRDLRSCGDSEWLKLYEWRDELLRRGDITILPLAENCYGGTHLVLTIQNRSRFYRWRNRLQIPRWIRKKVYARDGHQCVKCGATEPLTLDHIIPWSRGGEDTVENLQTMCQSCNSRKGNRLEVDA